MDREAPLIRRKQHTKRMITLMPRRGLKTIAEREITVTLPHVTFVDGEPEEAKK